MKKIMSVGLILAIFAVVFIYFNKSTAPSSTATSSNKKIPLPWNITTFNDGSAEVFSIHLSHTTLNQVIEQWGLPDSIALFSEKSKKRTLEVYYTHAPLGPMKASIVLTLAISDKKIQGMLPRVIGQEGTDSGSSKLYLSENDQRTLGPHLVTSLAYIPGYKGLESDYFEEHLGKPKATLKESPSSVSWFYPSKGLTLVINDEGKEVFHYQTPSSFSLPEQVQLLK
jgi:hypothetical protein